MLRLSLTQRVYNVSVYVFVFVSVFTFGLNGSLDTHSSNMVFAQNSSSGSELARLLGEEDVWLSPKPQLLTELEAVTQSGLKGQRSIPLIRPTISLVTKERFKSISAEMIEALKQSDTDLFKQVTQPLLMENNIRRVLKGLLVSHAIIEQRSEWKSERELYLYGLFNIIYFEELPYLRSRFGESVSLWEKTYGKRRQLLSREVGAQEIQALNQRQIIGGIDFWIKRDVDGSREVLFKLLESVYCAHIEDRMTCGQLAPTQTLLPSLAALSSPEELGDIYQTLSDHPQRLIDPTFWKTIAGLPLERPLGEGEKKRPFLHLNPKLIIWGIDHLIPSPDVRLNGGKARDIYHKEIAPYAHLFFSARRYLNTQRELQREKVEYALARLSPQFNELDYVSQRYAGVKLKGLKSALSLRVSIPQAIGFWIRREIDGTSALMDGALRRLIQTFEPSWLKTAED